MFLGKCCSVISIGAFHLYDAVKRHFSQRDFHLFVQSIPIVWLPKVPR